MGTVGVGTYTQKLKAGSVWYRGSLGGILMENMDLEDQPRTESGLPTTET